MRVPGLVDDEEDQLKTDPILKMFLRKDTLKRKETFIKKRKCWPAATQSQCLTMSQLQSLSRPPTPVSQEDATIESGVPAL